MRAGGGRPKSADKALEDALAVIPNVPLDDVPVGADETRQCRSIPLGRTAERAPALGQRLPAEGALRIGEALGGMDFETAAKLSGSRFVVLKGDSPASNARSASSSGSSPPPKSR
jgi:seryl-tRNA synthetase